MAEGSNLYDSVLAVGVRAGSEPDLKTALLADPRAVILTETGASIPADWDVRAIEQADGTIALDLANDDLPDDYLALVSGALGWDDQNPRPSACDPSSALF